MSLKIDLTPILQEVGRTAHFDFEERLSWPEDGLDIRDPLIIEADLMNTGELVVINAKIFGKVKIKCARCAEDFVYPIKFEFEEEYSSNIPAPAKKKGEVELTKKDFIFKIEKDNTIDLGEAVRQNILTELPIKPLCKKCPEKEEGN